MTQRVDFIDVSHWQDKIDWAAVAEQNPGLIGVIAKCTEGKSYLDPEYAANRAGALQYGLAFSPYHYLHHGDAAGQMAWFLSKAQLRQGERIVLDYEEMDPPVRISDLQEAIFKLRADRPDLEIAVYGASKLTEDVDDCADTTWLDGTSLWAARYSEVNQPTVAKAWPYWSAWQFSDDGSIKGYDGDIDVNTFNGSKEACRAWFGPAAEVPAWTPEEVVEPVEPVETSDSADVLVASLKLAGHEVIVQIDTQLDCVVSVWVDGQVWEESVR
jgi:GH25 family lysozyme M1 (1,4-beta-N-acetylmuramidase)